MYSQLEVGLSLSFFGGYDCNPKEVQVRATGCNVNCQILGLSQALMPFGDCFEETARIKFDDPTQHVPKEASHFSPQ